MRIVAASAGPPLPRTSDGETEIFGNATTASTSVSSTAASAMESISSEEEESTLSDTSAASDPEAEVRIPPLPQLPKAATNDGNPTSGAYDSDKSLPPRLPSVEYDDDLFL